MHVLHAIPVLNVLVLHVERIMSGETQCDSD